jgi:hypothetical protein|uniref:Uncharacterized protein n=2 Tax=Mus TaxID=862507 RepID=Q3TQB5_MOUSE|nr:unnamed protein product [Mus musculus]BAE37469.1 unnamed protein product [Mus musculus]
MEVAGCFCNMELGWGIPVSKTAEGIAALHSLQAFPDDQESSITRSVVPTLADTAKPSAPVTSHSLLSRYHPGQ